MRKRILLSGYYGHGNFGDELMLQVMCRELHRIYLDCEITIRDDSALSHGWRPLRLIRWLTRQWHDLNVDWLIFGGGTVFHTRVNLCLQLAICALARLRGARIAALGVGTEARSKWLLRRIVGLCECFCVRDDYSKQQCGPKAIRTADIVFCRKFAKPVAGSEFLRITERGPLKEPDFNGIGWVVSSRLHPLIMAAIHGIRFNGVGNSIKVREFCRSFNELGLEAQIRMSKYNFQVLKDMAWLTS